MIIIKDDLNQIKDFKIEAKKIIEDNWEYIKEEKDKLNKNKSLNKIPLKVNKTNYTINLIKIEKKEEILNIINMKKVPDNAFKYNIYKESRMIKFFHLSKNKLELNENLVCNPKDINFYLKKYNIQLPKYKLNNEAKSISSNGAKDVFKLENVTEIYDAKNESILNINDFSEVLGRTYEKVSDNYINAEENEISNNINNGKYIITDRRIILENKIKNFIINKDSFLFLTGPRKIGKSLTILQVLNTEDQRYIYFDLSLLKKLDKKKKYNCLIKEFYRLFDSYSIYIEFMKDFSDKMIGLDNILKFILKFIDYISKLSNLFEEKIIIIIDNYDDLLVQNPIDQKYVEAIQEKLLMNKQIKFIICGSGQIFNEMIYNYFKGNSLKYNFFYINNMGIMNLENYNNNPDEYLEYLNEKYKNNLNQVIFFIILFKKLTNPITGFDDFKNIKEFPSQFYEFIKQKGNNKIIIQFYKEDVFKELENKIKYNNLNDLVFQDLKYFKNNSFKGFVEEELIINLIEIGKLLSNFQICKENIITVNELINIKNEKIINEIKVDLPILIKQLSGYGESIDIILIVNKKAIFIQIGINKEKSDIDKVKSINYDTLLKNVSTFLDIQLNSYEIVFIFEKEHQEQLYKDFNDISNIVKEKREYLLMKYKKLKPKTNLEKADNIFEEYEEKSKKLSYFSSTVGAEVCKTYNIPYLLFSISNFKLYNKENILLNSYKDLLDSIEEENKIPKNIINQLKQIEFFKDISKVNIYSKMEKKIFDGMLKGDINLNFNNFYLNCNELSFNDFNIEYYEDKNEYKKVAFKNGIIVSNEKITNEEYSDYYLIKYLKKKREREDE